MPKTWLVLDTDKKPAPAQVVRVRQGDTNMEIGVDVRECGVEYDFSNRYVALKGVRANGSWVHVVDGCKQIGNTNKWLIDIPVEVTSVPGNIACYVEIRDVMDPSFHDTTGGFTTMIDPSAAARGRAEPYSDQIDALLVRAETIVSGLESTNNDLATKTEDLFKEIQNQVRELARGQLSSYIDDFLVASLDRNFSGAIEDVVRRITPGLVRESLLNANIATLGGVLGVAHGGTGFTTKRDVKLWLGIPIPTYEITFTGENFTLSGDGVDIVQKKATVEEDTDLVFGVEASEGYRVDDVTCEDASVYNQGDSWLLTNITKATTVTIATVQLFTVTFSGENFVVIGPGVDSEQKTLQMAAKDEVTVTITPTEGYKIDSVEADNSAEATSNEDGTYTIKNVTQETTVTVTASSAGE